MDALRSQRHQPKVSRCDIELTGDPQLRLGFVIVTGIRAVSYRSQMTLQSHSNVTFPCLTFINLVTTLPFTILHCWTLLDQPSIKSRKHLSLICVLSDKAIFTQRFIGERRMLHFSVQGNSKVVLNCKVLRVRDILWAQRDELPYISLTAVPAWRWAHREVLWAALPFGGSQETSMCSRHQTEDRTSLQQQPRIKT